MADDYTIKLFGWLNQVLADEEAGARPFQVGYVLVTKYHNRSTGDAWPSIPTIAADVHVSPRRAQDALAVLIQRGHLECKQGGKGRPNRYRLIMKDGTNSSDHAGGAPESTDEIVRSKGEKYGRNRPINDPLTGRFWQHDRTKSSETNGRNRPCNHLNEPSDEPSDSPREKNGNTDFDEFWRQYPRRKSKQAALKAYKAALKKAPASLILQGAMRYAAARHGQDPKYTKHPATWLSAGCWDDEPDPPKLSVAEATIQFLSGKSADDRVIDAEPIRNWTPPPAPPPPPPPPPPEPPAPRTPIRHFPKLWEAFAADQQVIAKINVLPHHLQEEAAKRLAMKGQEAARTFISETAA